MSTSFPVSNKDTYGYCRLSSSSLTIMIIALILILADIAQANGHLEDSSSNLLMNSAETGVGGIHSSSSRFSMSNIVAGEVSGQDKNLPNHSRSNNEYKRRVEYSKPDSKSFKRWETRRWTKDHGSSISRRIRRSNPTTNTENRRDLPTFLLKNKFLIKDFYPVVYRNSSTNRTMIYYKPKKYPPPNWHPKQQLYKPNSKLAKGQSIHTKLKKQQLFREKLESVLDVPGVECGKVPLYEKLYHRSINESYEIDPDTGEFRILHGLDTIVGEWPWIVRITECKDIDSCSTCTGTLLNDRWIITAGHCAFNQTTHPEWYNATFGLYDLVSPESTSFSLPIEKMIVHPDYKDLSNDLTLMKLAKPVTFSDMIRPACLVRPTRNVLEFAKGKRCYTVGYGLIDGMEDAIRLQKLEIRAKQPNECNSYELGAVQLKSGTVCIGPPPGKMGSSCKGDSGGPDLCYDPKHGSWYIFATVSYGPPVCDRENGDSWLTVSVDLSNYRTWILSTILANS